MMGQFPYALTTITNNWIYTVSCDVLACRICVSLHHKIPEHQTKDVKTAYGEHMKTMNAAMNRLANEAALCETKSQELCKTEQKIMSSIKKDVEIIDKAVELVVANAYKEGNALKTELEQIQDIKLKDCHRQKLTLQKQAHDLRRAVTETKSILRDTLSHNFVILNKAITERLKALEGQSRNEELVQYTPCELKFKRAQQLSVKLGELVPVGDGQVSVQQVVLKKNFKDKILNIDVSAKLALHFCNIVENISLNRIGDILVTSDGRKKVCIFRKQEDGCYKQTFLNSSEETKHIHVAIAPDDRFLVCKRGYIHSYSSAGKNLTELHRIGLNPRTSDVNQSSVKFTTTDDGRIVVEVPPRVFYGTGRGAYRAYGPFLELLTPDGNLIKTISISNANIDPKCITVINNTHVALSDLNDNVGVFDLKLDEEYSMFKIRSSGSRRNQPRPICYDKKTDCLLIGNRTNDGKGVIEQYSFPTGRFVGCIAQYKEGVPIAIALSGDGSIMLAVTTSYSNLVILYAVSV